MATRYEKVVLDIESKLAPVMIRDAAAAKLLEGSLKNLDGTSVRTSKSVSTLDRPISESGVQSARASKEIDRYSGRIRLLADIIAILGPAAAPIAAVAVPAVTGLAAQLGAAALAGGTAILAFQGVGDALKAVNKAALEPSTTNLEAARLAMEKIGPDARNFVNELHDILPALQGVRNAAAAGLFPGVTESLGDLESMLPRVEDMVYSIGDALGSLVAEGAQSLAGPRWAEFLEFVEIEVPRALVDLAHTVGNLTHGLAEMWMAFDPLNDDFSKWMLDASAAFDQWAQGLSQTEGFAEFVDYVRDNGPKVADALGSIGNAILQIVEAAAPLGGPVLQALAAVSDAIAAIADSDAGPSIMATVTALALLSRGMKTFDAVSTTSWGKAVKGADTFTGKLAASRGIMLKSGAALAGVALASSDAAEGFTYTNTASMALMGTLGGPWGAAMGAAVGLSLDLAKSHDVLSVDVESLTATLNQQTGAITQNTRAYAANELEKQGILETAQSLGLNLKDVTRAALGNADAMARVSDALNAADAAFFDANGRVQVGTEELMDFRTNAETVRGAIGDMSGALDASQSGFGRVAQATGNASDKFRQAKSAAQSFREEVERLNRVLEGRASLRDYEAALDDLTKSVKENGKSLDITTRKGRDNQAALDAIAASAIKVAEGMKGSNRVAFLQQARKDFVDAAQKLGLARDRAQELADKLGLVDRSDAKPTVEIDGWAVAVTNLSRVKSGIDALHDKTVTIHVQRVGDLGVDFASGGNRTPRPIAPRSTTFNPDPNDSTGKSIMGSTYARSVAGAVTSKADLTYGIAAAAQASIGAARGLRDLSHASEDHLKHLRRELTERERILSRELEQADKKWQAERDLLKEMRDARRSLMQDVSGNFMSGLFGNVDLKQAFEDGTLGSDFGQALLAWVQGPDGPGYSGGPMSDYVDQYLATLSPEQIQALQGQATSGTLAQDTRNAEQFAQLLQQLTALGLDGGLFSELASSGNIGAAQYYATLTADQIDALEQQYEQRNQAAQAVGQQAANAVWADAIKDQLKESRAAREEFREAKHSLHRIEDRLQSVEHAIEKLPAPIGHEVGRAVNGAVAAGQRRA